MGFPREDAKRKNNRRVPALFCHPRKKSGYLFIQTFQIPIHTFFPSLSFFFLSFRNVMSEEITFINIPSDSNESLVVGHADVEIIIDGENQSEVVLLNTTASAIDSQTVFSEGEDSQKEVFQQFNSAGKEIFSGIMSTLESQDSEYQPGDGINEEGEDVIDEPDTEAGEDDDEDEEEEDDEDDDEEEEDSVTENSGGEESGTRRNAPKTGRGRARSSRVSGGKRGGKGDRSKVEGGIAVLEDDDATESARERDSGGDGSVKDGEEGGAEPHGSGRSRAGTRSVPPRGTKGTSGSSSGVKMSRSLSRSGGTACSDIEDEMDEEDEEEEEEEEEDEMEGGEEEEEDEGEEGSYLSRLTPAERKRLDKEKKLELDKAVRKVKAVAAKEKAALELERDAALIPVKGGGDMSNANVTTNLQESMYLDSDDLRALQEKETNTDENGKVRSSEKTTLHPLLQENRFFRSMEMEVEVVEKDTETN
jgi:hypothetical protein